MSDNEGEMMKKRSTIKRLHINWQINKEDHHEQKKKPKGEWSKESDIILLQRPTPRQRLPGRTKCHMPKEKQIQKRSTNNQEEVKNTKKQRKRDTVKNALRNLCLLKVKCTLIKVQKVEVES